MNHADHVNLLRAGIPTPGGVWADFGAGTGAFTLALADLLGPDGTIHAIDQNGAALRSQQDALRTRFPTTTVLYHVADFRRPLDLPPLDGLVIANALHFQREPEPVVHLLRSYLRADGRFLIVEYNIERGNYAVPYPIPYSTWQKLAQAAGFAHTKRLATRPSRFLHEIYSAASW
jgi:ubiquinone/menaquinone biosynthesis C-methylase UbiE